MELTLNLETLKKMQERLTQLEQHLAVQEKLTELASLESETAEAHFWDDAKKAQSVLKAAKEIKRFVDPWQQCTEDIADIIELFVMAQEEQDTQSQLELQDQYHELEARVDKIEFLRKLSGQDDNCPAVLSINSGAGGTESCDWAEILYRMYARWIERKGFKATIVEMTPGETAGIKSITLEVEGEFVYGHLKAENGVHRLVRISPFDSSARRHTSFASVYSYPIFDEVDDYELLDKDIRVDTYRASGAGGQHVNKTDSAVRMTHIPTNIVVTCQNERSQIKNREWAMKMLKARVRLHYKEEEERARLDKLDDKKKIEWGSQIRSYVLHPYNMVKDHRTGVETSNTQGVLDGDLDAFIEGYLLAYADE